MAEDEDMPRKRERRPTSKMAQYIEGHHPKKTSTEHAEASGSSSKPLKTPVKRTVSDVPKPSVKKTPKSTASQSDTPVSKATIKTPKIEIIPKAETPVLLEPPSEQEIQKLKHIAQQLSSGKKGFKHRGRPKDSEYEEMEQIMMKIELYKEVIDETPFAEPPPKRARRKSVPRESPLPVEQPPNVEQPLKVITVMKKPSNDVPYFINAAGAVVQPPPQVVSPFINRPQHSDTSKLLMAKRLPPPPQPHQPLRYIRPFVSRDPRTQKKPVNMSALKNAIFLRKPLPCVPSSSKPLPCVPSSSRTPTLEKENAKSFVESRTTYNSNESHSSPSIITYANYPNSSLSLEPNERYCLVDQNGRLIYPQNELDQTPSSEPEPSPSPPSHNFFEPYPNYYLTVL